MRLYLVVFVMLASILSGCSSSKSKVGGVLNLDTDLKLTFVIGNDVNPDENDRPSPVFVRMYQLKSPVLFRKADFIDLYERDEELLGSDFVSKQVLKPMAPGETREERFVLQEGTRYVALYAEFSQYRGSSYKIIFPVTENNIFKNKAAIQVSGTQIKIIDK